MVALAFPVLALASPVSIPNQFADGDVISANAFNENFDAIAAAIDDNDARLEAVEASVGGLGVPAGSIVFFAADTCPAGWSEVTDLRGRVPVGVPAGGTVSTTVGTALEDEGTRTISQVPLHSHAAGSLAATAGNSGAHTHTMQSAGNHDHNIYLEAFGNYGTWGVSGVVNSAGGDVTGTPITSAGAHTHAIDAAGSHSHAISLSGNTASAGAGSVDVTMPYVQLLGCSKD